MSPLRPQRPLLLLPPVISIATTAVALCWVQHRLSSLWLPVARRPLPAAAVIARHPIFLSLPPRCGRSLYAVAGHRAPSSPATHRCHRHCYHRWPTRPCCCGLWLVYAVAVAPHSPPFIVVAIFLLHITICVATPLLQLNLFFCYSIVSIKALSFFLCNCVSNSLSTCRDLSERS